MPHELAIHRAIAETGKQITFAPALMHGRVELLWYAQEQSISLNYHRDGNLGMQKMDSNVEMV